MGIVIAPVGHKLITPQRTYNRGTAAIGIVELDGAVPFTVAAYSILQKHEVAMLRPFLLGSATGALVFAGDVAEVRGATDPDWLMQEEILGRFHKRKPLVGTTCFEGPSAQLWSVMQDLKPMEIPDLGLIEDRLTLAMVECLRIGPYLEAMEIVGRREGIVPIGSFNFGSKHQSFFFAGEQGLATEAKFAAKDHVRALMAAQAIDGEYDGSWYLVLGQEHHDLQFLLPWDSNPRPFKDVQGLDSYLAIETQGLTAFFQAVNAAAWRSSVMAIAPQELGSGTETAMLVSAQEDAVNEAAEAVENIGSLGNNLKGESSLINVRCFHHPKGIFGANMSELIPATPLFDMAGLSLGLVDVRDRGGLYDAVHELRRHDDCRYIGMRKIGSRRAFMTFAGPQDEVAAALEDIKERAERELVKTERCGELFATGIIENPNEQVLRLLPWQKPSRYFTEVPENHVISAPYYEPGDPFAFVETLGMSHGLKIANYLMHEGVTPLSVYGVGSGLKVFHFTAKDYDLLTELLSWKRLNENACFGMSHTADAKDGLDRMLVNVATYAEPGPIWQMVDHQQPVASELYQRLLAKEVGVGLITLRGMNPTLFFLDQLKEYGVDLWGIQKSGGLHMTPAIYGPLGQVRDAIDEISAKMLPIYKDLVRTWAVISNPHPNLAFFLMRDFRVNV